MIKWCKLCVLPNTRPNLNFNREGICSACINHKRKNIINWKGREKELKKILNSIKKKNKIYDCLIPVSGGKDSTWQTLKCLELGLRPLALTWKTPFRSEIGNKNLNNLINLGVDHIDWTINPKFEKKVLIEALKKKGSTAILMHMAIFNIPQMVASKFNIPLIIWGENSAYEYANEKNIAKNSTLTKDWFKKFGVTDNFKIDKSIKKNKGYSLLFQNSFLGKKTKVRSIFLGHYYNWDPVKINNFVKKKGFKNEKKPKVGLYNFADIDDECLINIHHWLKWYKYGFTRIFDNLSLEIRNKRITRKQALTLLEKHKFEYPINEIKKFCRYCEISIVYFFKIIKNFRNKKIWKKNRNGKYFIQNFIINRKWNETY